ncbi:MAG: HD domain-containing protein [Clostridia bacterium]|nr:HD domain-containing protein [Clostridia bacterium]
MITFPEDVTSLIQALNARGHEAYAVGGCVRDSLLGIEPNDWDLTTGASPKEIAECFQSERISDIGFVHGTITVYKNGIPYEITAYRKDGEYTDHRRPDRVEFVKELSLDLARRDFTINAMACHPETGIVDLFSGLDDLKNGVIRTVGDPEKRFREDSLRILRAIRFASAYGFVLEENTRKSAIRLADSVNIVSPERILIEIKRMLTGKGIESVLTQYSEIIFSVFPELSPMRDFPQNTPHHAYDVWTHTAKAVSGAPNDEISRLTMLFHDSGKPHMHTVDAMGVSHFRGHPAVSVQIAEKALARLKCDKNTLNRVLKLVSEHEIRIPAERKSVRREMARLGKDVFSSLLPLLRADFSGQNPAMHPQKYAYADQLEAQYHQAISEGAVTDIHDLDINGNDLKAAGLRGSEIGLVLHALFALVLSEEIENRKSALMSRVEEIRKNISQPGH